MTDHDRLKTMLSESKRLFELQRSVLHNMAEAILPPGQRCKAVKLQLNGAVNDAWAEHAQLIRSHIEEMIRRHGQ